MDGTGGACAGDPPPYAHWGELLRIKKLLEAHVLMHQCRGTRRLHVCWDVAGKAKAVVVLREAGIRKTFYTLLS